MIIVQHIGNKQKEEYKSHSEIIINFGFSTRFWPKHTNSYQKYDHA